MHAAVGGVWKATLKGKVVVIKRMVPVDMLGEINQAMSNAGSATQDGRNEGFIQELVALSTVDNEHVLKVMAFNNIGAPLTCLGLQQAHKYLLLLGMSLNSVMRSCLIASYLNSGK